MTIFARPDEKVFASGAKPGELVPFPDVLRGWGLAFEQTEGKPPMEWMNGAFLRLNEAVRYFMQRGLPEWSATEDYPAGAYLQHAGKSYLALLANTNVEPGTAALTWAEVAPTASTTTKGLIEIATATEAKALASALLAITPSTLGEVLANAGYASTATFAEIAALTENDGPIICTDMAGDLYTWTDTAFFTGYRNPRSGLWYGGASDTPEAWELPARGGVWLESDPKHKRVIARYREWGRVKSVGDWAAKWNFIADLGGGQWKAPDLRDVFQRMDGTDADTANARLVGSWQQPSIQPYDFDGSGSGTVTTSAGSSAAQSPSVYGMEPVDNAQYRDAGCISVAGVAAASSPGLFGSMRVSNAAVAPVILI